MPAQKIKKQSSTKPNKWRKRALIIAIAILMIVLGAIAFDIYSQAQFRKTVEAEKAQFEAVDRDVHAVAERIKLELNPEKDKFKKECTTQSRDYEVEPIVCSVSWSMEYDVESSETANYIYDKFSKILKSQKNHFKFIKSVQLADGDSKILFLITPQKGTPSIASELYKSLSSNLICPASYELFRNAPSPTGKRSSYKMKITLDCGSELNTAIYPVNNSI